MSKQQFKAEDFGHVKPALIGRIESIIADRKFGRLSSGAIYKAHNELFKLRENPQTCTSCLIIRGDKLAKWYEWQAKDAAPKTVQLPVTNVGTGDEPDLAAPQETHDLADGRVLTLHADGVVKIGDDVVTEGAFLTKDGVALAVRQTQLVSDPEGADIPAVQVTGGAPDSMPAAQTEEEARANTLAESVANTTPQIILQKINKDDYAKTEGDAFFGIFTPGADDATKGTVVNAETGKALAAGTYATENIKQVLTVQPGGKAAYKAV